MRNEIVLYISSKPLKQTIEHSIKEAELTSIEFNNQIGNNISLTDFIKYKAITLGDADVDYFIIDLGALKDSDEEIIIAIRNFLMTHERSRIIIISQIHEAGNRLLSNLFSLGIRNFAVSDDYVYIKNKLSICISEQGMSYKDAYEFNEVKDSSKVKALEIKEINKVLIGIIGCGTKVGVTHNSIIIGNELKKMGYSVAIVEMNKSGAFEDIRLSERLNFIENFFTSRNIDYYPNCNKEVLKDILNNKVYNFLILDYGNYETSDISSFNKAHIKIAIGNVQAWEINNIISFWNLYDNEARENINLYLNFVEKEIDRKELKKIFERNIGFIPYYADPFREHSFPELKERLKDYLPVNKGGKKKIFGIF